MTYYGTPTLYPTLWSQAQNQDEAWVSGLIVKWKIPTGNREIMDESFKIGVLSVQEKDISSGPSESRKRPLGSETWGKQSVGRRKAEEYLRKRKRQEQRPGEERTAGQQALSGLAGLSPEGNREPWKPSGKAGWHRTEGRDSRLSGACTAPASQAETSQERHDVCVPLTWPELVTTCSHLQAFTQPGPTLS